MNRRSIKVGKLRVIRPDIVVSHRASIEAINTQLDLEVMLAVAVVEQARHFRAVHSGLLKSALASFDRRSRSISAPLGQQSQTNLHIHRVATLLAATRILGRARILRETGLPLELGRGRMGRAYFDDSKDSDEILGQIGVDQAVAYLQSLPVATRQEWEQLVGASAHTAFTAAGIEDKAALEALKQMIAQSLAENWSRTEFESQATALLKTFETEAGSLRTLWNTVTASAMAKGREEMLNDKDVVKIVGYRLYDAILDNRTRFNHALLDGGIAPSTWFGWLEYAPPNGFNCRCTLVGITSVRAKLLLSQGSPYYDLTENIPLGAGPDAGFDKLAA